MIETKPRINRILQPWTAFIGEFHAVNDRGFYYSFIAFNLIFISCVTVLNYGSNIFFLLSLSFLVTGLTGVSCQLGLHPVTPCHPSPFFCTSVAFFVVSLVTIHDSIKSRVLAKQPNVVVAGCPCHMLHNTAAKGATAFADATGFDLEDHCVDLFYWFDKSTKRKGILKQYCMFCDTKYGAVVKYVSVRWLCLERCLDRELKKYHALKSYFLSEHESDNRFKRLNELFQRPMSEIYLMFFQSSIALLTNFNRFLQREDPLI